MKKIREDEIVALAKLVGADLTVTMLKAQQPLIYSATLAVPRAALRLQQGYSVSFTALSNTRHEAVTEVWETYLTYLRESEQ